MSVSEWVIESWFELVREREAYGADKYPTISILIDISYKCYASINLCLFDSFFFKDNHLCNKTLPSIPLLLARNMTFSQSFSQSHFYQTGCLLNIV